MHMHVNSARLDSTWLSAVLVIRHRCHLHCRLETWLYFSQLQVLFTGSQGRETHKYLGIFAEI